MRRRHYKRLLIYVVGAAVILAASQVTEARAAVAPRRVTVKLVHADHHQREMIGRVLTACDAIPGVSRKVLIASVATITQESAARNLRGGDRDSVGLFQIRRMHIDPSEGDRRRVPEWAARWFCMQAKNVDHHRPHLTVAQLSQSVQRSCCPSAYGRWTREAVRTYRLTLHRP